MNTYNDSLNEENIKALIEEKINRSLSLSIKQLWPALFSIVITTIGIVWWFHGIIGPIEQKIAILTLKNGLGKVVKVEVSAAIYDKPYFLEGISNDNLKKNKLYLTKNHVRVIKDVAYALKQRSDLVVIVAGYTNKNDGIEQEIKVGNSNKIAVKLADAFDKLGINKGRIFSRGYGDKIPLNFPQKQKLNIGIIVCDLFVIMQEATI